MLVVAATYLTYAEAVVLYHELLDVQVVTLVKSCGPPSLPYGDGLYYQLLLEETEADAAQATLADFAARRAAAPQVRCARCGAEEVGPAPRRAWWQRWFYAGTTLYKCQACGAEFSG